MNTMVWLHNFTFDGKKHQVVHGHNAVADYRGFDPNATSQQIDVASVADLIEALRECVSDIKLTESCYGQHDGAQDAIRRGEAALARCGGVA